MLVLNENVPVGQVLHGNSTALCYMFIIHVLKCMYKNVSFCMLTNFI